MTDPSILPKARKANLVVQTLEKELLIYDLDENKAYCLNETARLIYDQCDGKTTMAQAAKRVGKKLKSPVDDQIFQMALYQLKTNNLLDADASVENIQKVSRRRLVQTGLALGVALPAIGALVVPAGSVLVGTCRGPQQSCTGTQDCCDNTFIPCNGGICCAALGTSCVPGACCEGLNCGNIFSNSDSAAVCCFPDNVLCEGPSACCSGFCDFSIENGTCTSTPPLD